jgi:hypothetical protein
MIYLYKYLDTGEEFEFVRSVAAGGPLKGDTYKGRPVSRIYDARTVPGISVDQGGGITYNRPGLPISHSLPKMDLSGAQAETMGSETVYRKGKCLADARGRRVVRNKNDSDAHCRDTGFIRDSV